MPVDQTLQSKIEALPADLKQDILDTTDVGFLTSLKNSYLKQPDVLQVINARIENLTYLAV